MDISVGAEYVIANALILQGKKGVNEVPPDQLRNIGWKIQQQCNKTGVDAIILTSGLNLKAAVYGFSDYFEYVNTGEPMIRIKKSVPIATLKKRFIYYLPPDVAEAIKEGTVSYFKAS